MHKTYKLSQLMAMSTPSDLISDKNIKFQRTSILENIFIRRSASRPGTPSQTEK